MYLCKWHRWTEVVEALQHVRLISQCHFGLSWNIANQLIELFGVLHIVNVFAQWTNQNDKVSERTVNFSLLFRLILEIPLWTFIQSQLFGNTHFLKIMCETARFISSYKPQFYNRDLPRTSSTFVWCPMRKCEPRFRREATVICYENLRNIDERTNCSCGISRDIVSRKPKSSVSRHLWGFCTLWNARSEMWCFNVTH